MTSGRHWLCPSCSPCWSSSVNVRRKVFSKLWKSARVPLEELNFHGMKQMRSQKYIYPCSVYFYSLLRRKTPTGTAMGREGILWVSPSKGSTAELRESRNSVLQEARWPEPSTHNSVSPSPSTSFCFLVFLPVIRELAIWVLQAHIFIAWLSKIYFKKDFQEVLWLTLVWSTVQTLDPLTRPGWWRLMMDLFKSKVTLGMVICPLLRLNTGGKQARFYDQQ